MRPGVEGRQSVPAWGQRQARVRLLASNAKSSGPRTCFKPIDLQIGRFSVSKLSANLSLGLGLLMDCVTWLGWATRGQMMSWDGKVSRPAF